jgi:hypothetical protein
MVKWLTLPALYSGGPGFRYRPLRMAIVIEVFRGFSQSLHVNAGIVPYN